MRNWATQSTRCEIAEAVLNQIGNLSETAR